MQTEIKGKYTNAVCFTSNIEDEARKQIETLCNQPEVKGSKIRIMPDVHAGKGCTIGTTMTYKDKIAPALVGVDIGCGMLAVDIGKEKIDLEKFDDAVHQIPSGFDVWDHLKYTQALRYLKMYERLKNVRRISASMGTLGGGNHFIEIDISKNTGTQYLVIHSGSRNLGKQVAEYYINKAYASTVKNPYKELRQNMIDFLKWCGHEQEISSRLNELKNLFSKKAETVDKNLCFLEGQFLEDYEHDLKICQTFANLNREDIAFEILRRTGLYGRHSFQTVHNYVDTKSHIIRKGAISAQKGEIVLIPMNMRDGSILARGKGNPDWNYSAPHGAGRIMSRRQAKETLSMDDYKQEMAGVYSTSISETTLDEAPMAYKPMDEIVENIQETVEIIDTLKPIYNFKAN